LESRNSTMMKVTVCQKIKPIPGVTNSIVYEFE
jgi:hypothetical protein